MLKLGLIGNSVLPDIANAIRVQNGETALYKHSEMAPAVLALDGTQEGDALSRRPPRAAESLTMRTSWQLPTRSACRTGYR